MTTPAVATMQSTQAGWSSQICAALAVSDPDLDTSVGSVTRKIVDAAAASLAAATLDTQMLSYQYDINSMTGAALDAFVQQFGMTRYPALRATGTVTFTRGTATDVVTIPVAAQVGSSDGTVVVQTLTAGILEPAALSVTVPVQAVVSGPQGNVAAGALTQIMTAVSEVTSCTNVNALTGGANQETDTQLIARWKATVFKNMAGTSQMFLGIALNDQDCTAANVIDGQTRFREQLQISSNQAVSTVSDAQYVYPAGQVVGQDIDNGNIAAPGIQYTWDYSAIPPVVQVIDQSYFPPGQLIDVSFLYIDEFSRNSPAAGIYSRVDVWCAGQRPESAAATVKYTSATTFQASSSSSWYTGNFIRPDGTQPAAGNIFVPLPFGPILTVDSVVVLNGTTYGLASEANPLGTSASGVDYAYQIVHRTGAYGFSPYSDFGLEWAASMQPATGTPITISEDYTYNDVPNAIQSNLENWRMAGFDAQAHQGIQVQLQFSLAVIYDPSVTQSVTQAAISTAIQSYLSQLGFNSRIYPSSVLQAVENTPGVTACRFLTALDYPGWNPEAPDEFNVGIQAVYGGVVMTSYVDSSGNPTDIEFGAAQMPAFGGTVLVTKAGNTMGSFA
jgi:uncharacterized phage protein gp47/JayE